ncbi:hypothetical protein K7432_018641 [Basidiobolus ranarum]|uniref:DDE-1 domain-containing protein n=1 Tax=Basidiobolus ranarum TaxID=34480 RepID=A0ABR2W7T6_9FUNG
MLTYNSQLGTSEGVTSAQQQMDHRDNKETVSVLLCCNSSASDMVPPLVIGQYQNPRSLRDLQARPSDIQYEFNPPASLSVQILQKWLKWFDDRMSGRKVILLLDEVYSSTIEEWSLCHVRLHFLPSKSAIRTYPMSAGILENFRAHYKYSFASWLIQQAELGSLEPIPRLNLLDTLVLVAKSWCDISADVIRNSWNMAKVLPQEIDRSQLSLLSNLSDSPKLPSVLFTSTDSELTTRIESIMEHLSRVAPAAYADFLALMEEGNSIVNEETTPLIDEASFDSSTRSFGITPNPSNSNVSFGAHNLSNAEYLEYRRDEVEGSETHSENNLSEINHTDRIDSQHSPPSTSETTIQTTQTPLPLPSQSHFSAHDDYQPSQPTFYSDRQAQDAIRNLCLYFLYRTDSDVGARLMLDAEKILNEELRKRRQRAGPYHIPDSTNGNEPANKYKFTSGQGN